MNIEGQHYRTIWPEGDGRHASSTRRGCRIAFVVRRLATMEDAAQAIRTMIVRGAPLIGATAAYGIALAMRADAVRRAPRRGRARARARRGRPRSTCAGRSTRMRARAARRCAPASARRAPSPRPPRSATRTSRSAARIGEHGARADPRGRERASAASRSTCSPTATPAGSRPSTGARRWRRSTPRTTPASRSMSGSTRRGRATRARPDRVGARRSTACRTR